MNEIAYRQETFLDKSQWPERGPWDAEPDKAQWIDAETGLPCLAVRARSHWCGYVGVTEGHPLFLKDYDNADLSVHGGITFSGPCSGHICHVPEPHQPDHVWWFGFDCMPGGDIAPCTTQSMFDFESIYPRGGIYRTLDYVKSECRNLARQLKAAGETE